MKKGLFLILLFLFSCLMEERSIPGNAKNGVLNLENHSFESKPYLSLVGEWEFFWNQSPDQLSENSKGSLFVLPGHWNGFKTKDSALKGFGHATFRLKINLPKGLKEPMAITSLEQDTSYAIYANGEYLGGSGKPGSNGNETTPQVRSTLVVLPESASNHLVLDFYVANFSHRKGGPWNDIILSPLQNAQSKLYKNKMNEAILFSVLAFVSVFFGILYFYDPNTKHTLGIFLVTLVIMFRTISTGERILLDFIDLPYFIILRIEYLSWFWAAPVVYYYFYSVFPEDFSKKIGIGFSSISVFLSLYLITPSVYFTELASIYPFIFVFNGFFIFYYLFVSYINRRMQSNVLLAGTGILLLAAVNDSLHAEAIIHSFYVGPTAMVLFVFLQVFTFGNIVRDNLEQTKQFAEDQKALNQSYSRFVPKEFLFHLGKVDIRQVSLGEQVQKRMTILFADIRNFTEFSETLTPKENFDFLNSYLQRVGPIIRHNGGFIDKFIGDAVMALFPNGSNDAIRASVEMQEAIRLYNTHRANCNYPPIEVGIGIHTGNLTLGILGEHKRMEGTVISDAVNLASRIEGITKLFSSRIVISAETFIEATENLGYEYRLLDKVNVKGKAESVFVVEVLDGYDPEKAKRLKDTKGDYSLALEAYQRMEYDMAIADFKMLIDKNPDDSVSRLFLERCREAEERSKYEFGSL
ncbi:adenylate/guanylate cyclase domain-containing protein [Leptospira sp. 96542]|nr:adenylate/guanylate cyclase domain-containing protein [Leptospira sp. 96542]